MCSSRWNRNDLEVGCKTDTGRRRIANEDSLLVVKLGEVHLLAVADGLGGHVAGEVASRLALIEIEEFLKTNLAEGNLREAMQGAIAKANREIYLLSKENPAYAGMGTTLVGCHRFSGQGVDSQRWRQPGVSQRINLLSEQR